MEFQPDNQHRTRSLALDYQHKARGQRRSSDGQADFSNNMTPLDGVRKPEDISELDPRQPSFVRSLPALATAVRKDIILQTHLKPTGKPEELQIQVGLFFSDIPPTQGALVLTLDSYNIDIPAGAQDYLLEDRFVLPVDVELIAVLPHAHYIGKRVEAFAHLPGGVTKRLLRIPDWDFDWQDDFRYATPVHLPSGTTLQMRFLYDNSAANSKNPNHPPKSVRYGAQAKDEMGEIRFQVIPSDAAIRLSPRRYGQAILVQTSMSYDEFLLKRDPHDARAQTSRGRAQWSRGNSAEALASFRNAVRDDPADDTPHYYLGLMYRSRNQLAEARTEFETSVHLNPRNAKAQANLGIIQAALGEPDKADASLREALRLDPADRDAAECLEELRRSIGVRAAK